MNKIAAIQMASGPNISANLIEAGRLLAMAAESGAQLVVLPENFALMGMTEQDKVEQREREGEGPIQEFLSRQAERHELWIVGGTIPLESPVRDRIRAACLVYDAGGRQVARYDKIHLFDVALRESGEEYNESATIQPGSEPVVLDTPFGRLGLAVCYDLRFPELFRTLARRGAELIALPAAFTAITGKAHWEVLVRARAIENLCYLIASAQGGYHVSGRITHGDSMIVDPWGSVLDHLPSGSGIVIAEIDSQELHNRRRTFPALEHRRLA